MTTKKDDKVIFLEVINSKLTNCQIKYSTGIVTRYSYDSSYCKTIKEGLLYAYHKMSNGHVKIESSDYFQCLKVQNEDGNVNKLCYDNDSIWYKSYDRKNSLNIEYYANRT